MDTKIMDKYKYIKDCTLKNKNIVVEHNDYIGKLQNLLIKSNDKYNVKDLKKEIIDSSTKLNKDLEENKNLLGMTIIDFLFDIENTKNNGLLSETLYDMILDIYRILSSECSRINVRYIKMPKDWILLGFMSGFLEDLVIVMRTLDQLNISNSQLVSLDNFISKFKLDPNNFIRFPFIAKLLTQDNNLIKDYMSVAIKSQGKSKRIGIYIDENNIEFYYSIQGLLGKLKYDNRLVITLTLDTCPLYAIHFTKSDIARKIWEKQITTTNKSDRELPIGTICKMQRSIHALTNIVLDETTKKFHIISSLKDIRSRMTHGIKENSTRPKYQSGLVIDVKKLTNILPYGNVQHNEIGTLLVHQDIPHSCIITLIDSEEDIEYFWK
jgi:hypothetical protein